MVGGAATADGDATVGGALGVDDEMPPVGDGLAISPADRAQNARGSGSVAIISE